jgi:hypothetical protein
MPAPAPAALRKSRRGRASGESGVVVGGASLISDENMPVVARDVKPRGDAVGYS